MSVILVTGSGSGLGKEIADALRADDHFVIDYDIKNDNDVTRPAEWIKKISKLDVLINCAGINLNEWFDDLKQIDHQRVMDVNANGIVYMTQALLPQLIASNGTVINIVSNAAHMPMTSSLSYNMSKAAALMATKQMAHELTKKYGITVFSVSPNKLEGTGMSDYIDKRVCEVRGWTPEFAEQYQRNGLMHGQETPPKAVANMIAYLINTGDMRYLSGCDVPFGK